MDLRLTERWFREGLGFLPAGGSRLAMRTPLASRIQGLPKAASTCWWLVDRNEVFQLELFQFEKPLAKLMPADFRPCDIGYTRIGVWVADFDASLRCLEALGTSPLTPALGQRGARRVCVRSPDGVYVELMESDPLSTASSSTRRDCAVAVRSITLSVADLQQTASFIEQGIGLREAARVSAHPRARGAVGTSRRAHAEQDVRRRRRVGRGRAVPQSPRQAVAEDYRISDQGILNIAFGARNKRDFTEVYRRCVAAGARPNCPPVHMPGAGVVYVNDAQGFSFELCGPNPGWRIGYGASSPCRSPGGRRRTRRRSNSVCASRRRIERHLGDRRGPRAHGFLGRVRSRDDHALRHTRSQWLRRCPTDERRPGRSAGRSARVESASWLSLSRDARLAIRLPPGRSPSGAGGPGDRAGVDDSLSTPPSRHWRVLRWILGDAVRKALRERLKPLVEGEGAANNWPRARIAA